MSQENVELMRRLYRAGFAQRSVENVLDAVEEGFVWHQRAQWPGRSQYGVQDLPQLWADLDDTYSDFTLVPEDFTALGEYVLVTVRSSARVRAGDTRIEEPLFHLWQIRDG